VYTGDKDNMKAKLTSTVQFGLMVIILLLTMFYTFSESRGQQVTDPFEKQLMGTWALISITATRPDGTKEQPFGPGEGIMMFDGNGNYSKQFCSLNRLKYASNNRMKGTPEEYQATAQGCNTEWGKYTVDAVKQTLTMSIENASFPNWIGIKQTRAFSITGGQFQYTGPGSAGGTAVAIFRRAN
jgi:Lipocalin-like domain